MCRKLDSAKIFICKIFDRARVLALAFLRYTKMILSFWLEYYTGVLLGAARI